MKKETCIKAIKNLVAIFIIICIALSAVLVTITNNGGKVYKYFSYSAVAVLEKDEANNLEKNDLIIFKEKNTYEKDELIWYFISPNKTDISIIKQKENIEYKLIDKTNHIVEDVNIIGSKKYKISNIGTYILFIQNIPWYILLIIICTLVTIIYYLFKEKEIIEGENINV